MLIALLTYMLCPVLMVTYLVPVFTNTLQALVVFIRTCKAPKGAAEEQTQNPMIGASVHISPCGLDLVVDRKREDQLNISPKNSHEKSLEILFLTSPGFSP